MLEIEQGVERSKRGNGKAKVEEPAAEDFVGAAYLVDVEDLRKTVQELGQKLANADEINDQVHKICSSLEAAGVKREVIEVALAAQFGKVKTPRKRGPNRGDNPEPTEQELRVIAALTEEPMRKRDIFKIASVPETAETNSLLGNMQRYGWIHNLGGKGVSAGWVITEKGKALLAD